jgi:Cytidylate kinase
MTINDFNAYLEEHEAERAEIDRIIDAAQEEAIKQGNVIIESSLGVYLARGLEGELEKRGIKSAGIFIKADLQVRAQRVREGILVRKDRSAEVSTDVEVIANDLSIRDEADRIRFLEMSQGKFDISDENNYDLVIDSTETPFEGIEAVADVIISFARGYAAQELKDGGEREEEIISGRIKGILIQ